MKKSNAFIFGVCLCLIMLSIVGNVNAPISPTTLTATLNPGQSVTETKTVTIPEVIPAGDVVFAFDLTGTMLYELEDAQTYASDIMTALAGLISDVQFGVISFMDYNGSYNSYGYDSFYGSAGSGDYPYRLDRALTSDTTAVETAINALSLGLGGDLPQDYTRVIYESYSDPSIGYRVGAKKFLIIFGDAPTHDNDFYDMSVYTEWATYEGDSTGGDPGRDAVMDETSGPVPHPDDLDFQTTVAEAAAAGIIILTIDSSERFSDDYDGQYTAMAHESFQYMADQTGGQRYDTGGVINPGDIADAIAEMVEEELVIGTLTLSVSPLIYASWVSFTPPSYTDVAPGSSVEFEVTITVPAGTPPGTYNFIIWANGDGANYGEQEVTITVPAPEGVPEFELAIPTLTSAIYAAYLLIRKRLHKRK